LNDGAIAIANDLAIIGVESPAGLKCKHQIDAEFVRYHRAHFGVLMQRK
jgi:hypothetical protein